MLVPFAYLALSKAEFRAGIDSIVRQLEAHGYPEGSLGLCKSCWNGTQHYHVPCTNARHPEWAHFEAFGFGTDQPFRSPLPIDCLRLTPKLESAASPKPKTAKTIRLPVSEAAKERALAMVRGQCLRAARGSHIRHTGPARRWRAMASPLPISRPSTSTTSAEATQFAQAPGRDDEDPEEARVGLTQGVDIGVHADTTPPQIASGSCATEVTGPELAGDRSYRSDDQCGGEPLPDELEKYSKGALDSVYGWRQRRS